VVSKLSVAAGFQWRYGADFCKRQTSREQGSPQQPELWSWDEDAALFYFFKQNNRTKDGSWDHGGGDLKKEGG